MKNRKEKLIKRIQSELVQNITTTLTSKNTGITIKVFNN